METVRTLAEALPQEIARVKKHAAPGPPDTATTFSRENMARLVELV